MADVQVSPSTAPPAAPVTPPVESAPVPAPAPSSGPGPTDWRAVLPPELRNEKTLEKFKGPAELARSYVEIEKYRGRSVAIPGPDATPQEKDAFLARLGRPEAPDKYVLPLPESPDIDQNLVSDFKTMAHKLGLTQDQLAGITSWYGQSPMGNPALASEAMQTKAVEVLRNEWGGAYDYNLKVANAGVGYAERAWGLTGLRDYLEQTGQGNHPMFVKLFERLGKTTLESGGIPRDAQTRNVLAPEEAQAKINELMRTPEYQKGDRAMVDEVQRLYQLKHNG